MNVGFEQPSLLLKITPKEDLEIELDEMDIQGVKFTHTYTYKI